MAFIDKSMRQPLNQLLTSSYTANDQLLEDRLLFPGKTCKQNWHMLTARQQVHCKSPSPLKKDPSPTAVPSLYSTSSAPLPRSPDRRSVSQQVAKPTSMFNVALRAIPPRTSVYKTAKRAEGLHCSNFHSMPAIATLLECALRTCNLLQVFVH
eukprot:2768999-Amphidinium_carterae.1